MPIKTHTDESPSLNLTSMIDVLFLLIIFFMVGTKFTELERNIDLKVPQVSDRGALSEAPARKVINVYEDGQITLDGQAVSVEQLKGLLAAGRKQYQDLSVLVRGDAAGRLQRVAEVLAACKQVGVSDMGISVRIASRVK